jgi:hypothetical protein
MIRRATAPILALNSIHISWPSHADSQSNQSSSGGFAESAVDSRR